MAMEWRWRKLLPINDISKTFGDAVRFELENLGLRLEKVERSNC